MGLGLDTGESGDALFATTDAHVDARQDDKTEQDPDIDVPEVFEDTKILDRGGKDDGDTSGASVEGEGFGTKLDDSDRGDTDETNVEQEGVHECTGGLHGVNSEDEGDAETELEVTIDDAKHQPEGINSIEDYSEESPDTIHRSEPVVQEALNSKDGKHEDVNDP